MRQTSPAAKHFALRIPEDLWQVLLEKAMQEKRSINAQILIALEHDLLPSPGPVGSAQKELASRPTLP